VGYRRECACACFCHACGSRSSSQVVVAVVVVVAEGKGSVRSESASESPGDWVFEGGSGEGGVIVGGEIVVRGSAGSMGSTGSTGSKCSIESVVRKHRSLMVSFCGFAACAASGSSRCGCDSTGPLDSSDELSVHSGVESESKSGRGDRRFRACGISSSSLPETLGLGRLRKDACNGTTVTSGTPV
jgi:hypothetical protein